MQQGILSETSHGEAQENTYKGKAEHFISSSLVRLLRVHAKCALGCFFFKALLLWIKFPLLSKCYTKTMYTLLL